MKNNYWMKLWFDILRDPKMGMLPDRLWRRVIELFLIAGQEGEDGYLPNVSQIAWQLNKPVTAVVTDLKKIAETGIVNEFEPGKWMVTNFKKRNEPIESAKRMKDFRLRERYENSYATVTNRNELCYATVTNRREEEQKNRRTELKEQEGGGGGVFSDIYNLFDANVSKITPRSKILIDAAIETHSDAWVKAALEETIRQSKHSWAYCEGILKRWKAQGYVGSDKAIEKPRMRKLRSADGETIEVPA